MLIYTLIFILLFFGAYNYDYRKQTFLKGFYYILIFIVCTLMTGFRYRVGGDVLMYEDSFGFMPKLKNYYSYTFYHNDYKYQPGYLLFVAICKSINPDYYFYQFVHSVIFNSFFFWFVKKHSKYAFSTLFLYYIFLMYFYFAFEIQREIFAICCFFVGYNYFLKNKWVPYYLLCCIAFSFHISAVFMFFLPFFKLVEFSKKFLIISLIISVPILFTKFIFIDLIKVLLVTDAMKTKGEAYAKWNFSIAGILFYYFIRVVVFVPFLFYYCNNKLEGRKYDWMFVVLLWMSILSQVMVGFDRVNNYVYVQFFIFVTYFLYNKKYEFKNSLQKIIVRASVLLFMFNILAVKLIVSNIKGKYYYYSVYFPYESIFDKRVTQKRETFIRKMWQNVK